MPRRFSRRRVFIAIAVVLFLLIGMCSGIMIVDANASLGHDFWILDSFTYHGQSQPVVKDEFGASLSFTQPAKASGGVVCEDFRANYVANRGSIHFILVTVGDFSPYAHSEPIYCTQQEAMDWEAHFQTALTEITSYILSPSELELHDKDNRTVLRYHALGPVPPPPPVPQIGASLSAFTATYTTHKGPFFCQNSYCNVLISVQTTNGIVTEVSVIGLDSWNTQQSGAACLQFLPGGEGTFTISGNQTDYHTSMGDVILQDDGGGKCELSLVQPK